MPSPCWLGSEVGAAERFSPLSGLLPRALLGIAHKYSPIAPVASVLSGAGEKAQRVKVFVLASGWRKERTDS